RRRDRGAGQRHGRLRRHGGRARGDPRDALAPWREGARTVPQDRLGAEALELRQEGARRMEGRVLSTLRPSQIYRPDVMEDIHLKADLGRYRFRGFGTLRPRPLPSFDDLTFVTCSLTRIPLEGYRVRCSTKTALAA